ncbi:MAG: Fur family transcriptional regulator [Solirubrobacterales bacterium]
MARSSKAPWSQLALDALDEAGLRSGGARRAVVGLLAGEDCCLNAQEIADRLRTEGAGVGTASVYRALELLELLGLVQRVEVGEGGTRYEAVVPGGEHHHHVVCDTCGRITAFEDLGLERAIRRLEARLGHRVRGHEVVLRGECSRCAGRSGAARR